MTNVYQLFPKKAVRTLPVYVLGASPLEMRWEIEAQMFTVQCYTDLITSMQDPRDSFVARSMAKVEQARLDKMIAEYTGKFGALSL